MTPITREQIARLIPHARSMCLLDSVLQWDATSIRCLSRQHRHPDNPMRRPDGTLGAACGVEIAAQAMAVHGRLASGGVGPPVAGYLASLRDVRFGQAGLERAAGDLIIDAERLMAAERSASYRFLLCCDGRELVAGQAMVLFGAEPQ